MTDNGKQHSTEPTGAVLDAAWSGLAPAREAKKAQPPAPADARYAEAARIVLELKREKEDLAAQTKAMNEKLGIAERGLLDMMLGDGIEKFAAHGANFTAGTAVFAHVKAEDAETFHGWLRERGFGSLIKESVHPSTLRAWAREQKDAGSDLPPTVNVYEQDELRVRRSGVGRSKSGGRGESEDRPPIDSED